MAAGSTGEFLPRQFLGFPDRKGFEDFLGFLVALKNAEDFIGDIADFHDRFN
jgi:hypothetical protein